MKKLLSAATALAIFAGCSKDLGEESATVSATKGNTIELNLIVAPESRAVFDGDSHIIFESSDDIAAIIGVDPTDNYGIGSGTLKYNGDNDNPLFSGSITEIESEPTADQEFTVYGICPYSASVSSATRLDARTASLLSVQNPTQDHWDGKADAMIIEPTTINGTIESYTVSSGWFGSTTYYKLVSEPTLVKLAHLFGFGCITFESLPEDLLNEKVNKFTITATGDNKVIAGDINIDLRKNVFDEDFTYTPSKYSSSSSITLSCDGTIALKDYKAWFVANPGQYDVEINITTPNYTVSFKREGLNIKRSNITRPAINFNEATDVYKSTAIDLTSGKTWEHNTAVSYSKYYSKYFISSTNNPSEWGTLEDMPKVEYGITFSEDKENYPGGYNQTALTTGNRVYVQRLSSEEFTSGNVALKSGYQYAGVKCIKVSSGLYTYGDPGSCDISAFIIDKAGVKHQLGQAQHIEANTANSNSALYDFYFNAETAMTGNVEIVWDNFTGGKAFLSLLAINPAPEISAADNLTIYGQGGEGTIDVEISAADTITVESDAEWLNVSYGDGKIVYTAEPYAGDEMTRSANITITAAGFATATKTIAVEQLSSKYAEYTLTILPDDLIDALETAKDEYEASTGTTADKDTMLSFDTILKASRTDGSGETKDVDMHFENIAYGSNFFTETNDTLRYMKFDNESGFYNLKSLNKITEFIVGNSYSSKWYNEIYLCDSVNDTTGIELDTNKPTTNTSIPYMWTVTIDQSVAHGFFTTHHWTPTIVYSIKVTFFASN